jgi:hypothetical protein
MDRKHLKNVAFYSELPSPPLQLEFYLKVLHFREWKKSSVFFRNRWRDWICWYYYSNYKTLQELRQLVLQVLFQLWLGLLSTAMQHAFASGLKEIESKAIQDYNENFLNLSPDQNKSWDLRTETIEKTTLFFLYYS